MRKKNEFWFLLKGVLLLLLVSLCFGTTHAANAMIGFVENGVPDKVSTAQLISSNAQLLDLLFEDPSFAPTAFVLLPRMSAEAYTPIASATFSLVSHATAQAPSHDVEPVRCSGLLHDDAYKWD